MNSFWESIAAAIFESRLIYYFIFSISITCGFSLVLGFKPEQFIGIYFICMGLAGFREGYK